MRTPKNELEGLTNEEIFTLLEERMRQEDTKVPFYTKADWIMEKLDSIWPIKFLRGKLYDFYTGVWLAYIELPKHCSLEAVIDLVDILNEAGEISVIIASRTYKQVVRKETHRGDLMEADFEGDPNVYKQQLDGLHISGLYNRFKPFDVYQRLEELCPFPDEIPFKPAFVLKGRRING